VSFALTANGSPNTAQLGGKGSANYNQAMITIAMATFGKDVDALVYQSDAYNTAVEDVAVMVGTGGQISSMAALRAAGLYDVFILKQYWSQIVIAGAAQSPPLTFPAADFDTVYEFYGQFVDNECPAISYATGSAVLSTSAYCICQDNPDGITPYSPRPSFYGASQEVINEAVSNDCYSWDDGFALPKVPKGLVIGKPSGPEGANSTDGNPLWDKAEAFEFVLYTDKPEALAMHMGRRPIDPHDLSTEDAEEILNMWMNKFIDETPMRVKHEDGTDDGYMVNVLAEKSFDDLVGAANDDTTPLLAAGLTCIFLYAFITTGFSLLALGGVCLVVLGTAGGIGLSLWFGISLNTTSINVLPFLMMGLGVDDMFLFIRTLFNLASKPEHAALSPEDLVAKVYMDAGPSVVLTTITNFCAFMVGTLTPLPVVRDFALTASITVFVMFFTDLIGFPALCVIAMKHFPNVNIWNACCAKCCGSLKNGGVGEKAEKQAARPRKGSGGFTIKSEKGSFVTNYIVPTLASTYSHVVIAIFFCGLWALSVYGMTEISQGLSVRQLCTKGSQYYHFYEVRDSYFGFYPSYLSAYENDFSDPAVQQAYLDVSVKILDIEHSSKRTDGWLADFLYWSSDECVEGFTVPLCGGKMAPVCAVEPDTGLFGAAGTDSATREVEFFRCLNLWNDQTTVTSGPSFNALSNGGYGNDVIEAPLKFASLPFFSISLWETDEFVDLIDDVRDLIGDATGIELFPSGTIFTYWEQYRNLVTHLRNNLIIATACTFIIGTIAILIATVHNDASCATLAIQFVKAMQGSALMTLTIASTILSLMGFMGLANIELSAIPALTIIACMGICVDLTALVTLFFCSAQGTNQERITAALECVFIPTLDSMCSTIMGCLALAFSPIPLFVLYFFVMYVLVALIGSLNGLVLLPVLLAQFGPTYTPRSSQSSAVQKTNSVFEDSNDQGL